jgi:hypothetical protein
VDLSGLTPADRAHLSFYLPTVRRASTADSTSAPLDPRDPLSEITDELTSNVRGADLNDPRAFALQAPLDVLAPLLSASSFDRLARLREQRASPRPAPAAPEVPARSRDEISREVLDRHARHENVWTISREMKISRPLIAHIVNEHEDQK